MKLMTEEQMNRIAERNAQIFKMEWCQRQDGPFNLFQFPLFDFYAEYWITDANLDRLAHLSIEYLNEIDKKCAEEGYDRAFFNRFLHHVSSMIDTAAHFAWGCISLYQPHGDLYTPRIDEIADELHRILIPDEQDWLRRGRFYLCKALFCSAMTGVGHMDNMEDVDSTMEYLFKALMHAAGREIQYSELDENFIA